MYPPTAQTLQLFTIVGHVFCFSMTLIRSLRSMEGKFKLLNYYTVVDLNMVNLSSLMSL